MRKTEKYILLGLVLSVFVLCGCNRPSTSLKTAYPKDLQVYFFTATDDADAILILGPKASVMIDTGLLTDAPALLDNLKSKGVEKLDLLILTHSDKDHIGGAATIINSLQVDKVIMTNCTKLSEEQFVLNTALTKEGMIVEVPEENLELEFGELKLTIYTPKEKEYEDTNDYSIAVLAEYKDKRFFFAGDALRDRLAELLEENLPEVDVYKLPHHGRESKKAEKMLKNLNPGLCIVTAQKPEKEVRKAIEALGSQWRSIFDGEIKITVNSDTGELTVEQYEWSPGVQGR